MKHSIDKTYYIDRKPELMKKFEEELRQWGPFIFGSCGEISGFKIIQQTRAEFENLIPQIPYIGGDENTLTGSLIESAWYLAFYKAMKRYQHNAEETGKILYDAILNKPKPKAPGKKLTKKEFIEARRRRTEKNGNL